MKDYQKLYIKVVLVNEDLLTSSGDFYEDWNVKDDTVEDFFG